MIGAAMAMLPSCYGVVILYRPICLVIFLLYPKFHEIWLEEACVSFGNHSLVSRCVCLSLKFYSLLKLVI